MVSNGQTTHHRVMRLLAAWIGAALLVSVNALALEAPQGRVILTIKGAVSTPNQGDTAVFSMEMLARLPQTTFVTRTPWHKKPTEFTGPLVRDVLAAAGARGATVTATALNDYRNDIPVDDVRTYDVIVARLVNGKPVPVRELGPLFIMYPYDLKPELRSEQRYSRAVWQLSTITVQ